jgi:sugar phosphate isomerase/epimerase
VRVFGDVLPSGPPATRAAALEPIADGLNRLGEFAGTMQVRVVLETHGDFSDSTVVAALMPRIQSPSVGILWDTHHPWKFFDEPLGQTWDRLRPWVWHTHWKDSVSRPAVPARESSTAHEQSSASTAAHALMSGHREADYVLFGGGEFPAEECARLLKTSGYDGWLSLEWEKMWHPQLEVPEVALPLFANKMRALWERL